MFDTLLLFASLIVTHCVTTVWIFMIILFYCQTDYWLLLFIFKKVLLYIVFDLVSCIMSDEVLFIILVLSTVICGNAEGKK